MDGILITGGCYDLPKVAMHFVTHGRKRKNVKKRYVSVKAKQTFDPCEDDPPIFQPSECCPVQQHGSSQRNLLNIIRFPINTVDSTVFFEEADDQICLGSDYQIFLSREFFEEADDPIGFR